MVIFRVIGTSVEKGAVEDGGSRDLLLMCLLYHTYVITCLSSRLRKSKLNPAKSV